mmetsp:Transcript_7853/g.20173  ORF Transcript_7853/g.20173 Transcript_7853/m.20173 type:complete len:121 (-) Transcript_7853:385-747(-)|eukprot:CAMPEP_0182923060 /NCGR_PEP_ID=MMETSP0105_2-20130417/5192_1 /TAXON_ID=81532 ORGANISM="Acanthoeca-like sp., Strain 10tr" /NCGR_SAMPLE_ID=MMETSP0105_2 /ASSEMBLY_ACC=CAM_ASM_000205 /LENGTH=120 /DNA_ID=CAMNT_0025060739 /DNA_START=58 /DNA_END=420 /DNA_ORIENTATION=-
MAAHATEIESTEQWTELSESGKTVVVKCTAPWCGPCKIVAPVFDQIVADMAGGNEDVVFAVVDVDEQEEVAAILDVTKMPAFKVVKNGAVVDENIGADKEKLKEFIAKHVTPKLVVDADF